MILVTGGCGYIGSHTVLALLRAGYDVTVFDNLEKSSKEVISVLEKETGKKIDFIKGDLRNLDDLEKVFSQKYECVIHFAAYKNVPESAKIPDKYYENNVIGTYNLLIAMLKGGPKGSTTNIVFSSTCAVYGTPKVLPVTEESPLSPLSPYAKTKLCIEYMLSDFAALGLNSVRLRYFNVAGADPTAIIGEDPNILANLIPRLFGVVLGKYELKVFGNNFPTRDGCQIRDYIHVSDLADAHVKALSFLDKNIGSHVFNVGTGKGTTVKELIDEVEKVTGKKIPFEVTDPIPQEAIEIYGNCDKAEKLLGWKAKYDYHDMVKDADRWYGKG